jgi:PadR family transcriptional regulator PadR
MALQVSGELLDGCILSLLAYEDAYGYNLTHRVKNELGVSESTLYPVLRRLQKDGCLTVYDALRNGRNRRYYRITEHGRDKYRLILENWDDFKKRIDNIITKENENNDKK